MKSEELEELEIEIWGDLPLPYNRDLNKWERGNKPHDSYPYRGEFIFIMNEVLDES